MNRKREASSPVLILLSDNIKDQNHQNLPKYTTIDSPKFLIGRAQESNLTLLLNFISRKHCTFNYDANSDKWSIVSHSRKPVSVQGKELQAEKSTVLECGDKIKITPLLVFEFKCSPDGKYYRCCMDFKRARLSANDDEQKKEEDVEPISNPDIVGELDVSYPSMGYLDDDDGYFQDINNDDDDLFVPNDNNVDIFSNNDNADIISNDGDAVIVPNDHYADIVPNDDHADIVPNDDHADIVLNQDNMDDDVEPISNINIEEPDVTMNNDSELPNTLPISQLKDTVPVPKDFNNSFDNCSDSVTESFDKIDSDQISCSDLNSSPQISDTLIITSAPCIDALEKELQGYFNRGKRSLSKKAVVQQNLKDELNNRLEFIKKLAKFNSSCGSYFIDPSATDILNTSINELTSFFQNEYSEFKSRNVKTLPSSKKSDENLNRIILNMDAVLMEQTHQVTNYVCKFRESAFDKERPGFETQSFLNDDKPQTSHYQDDHDALVREKNDLLAEIEKIREENKKYKENSGFQESRVKFLEMKMQEKEKLEEELESTKEEIVNLEKQNADLKRSLTEFEIMELKYRTIVENNKYREEDKRDKDALQRTINTLQDELKALKDDNAQLINDKSLTTEEIEKLQKKCEELEEKVKEKIVVATGSAVACGSGNASGEEYCCDMVKEVKASLMELMDREFQCSICGELMVESTVTSCNHIFCSFCLQEWKKKQKKCPICRTALVKEVRAVIIDNYVTDLLKLISESMYAERMKVISERTAKKTPTPTTTQGKGRTARRNSRQVAQIVDLS